MGFAWGDWAPCVLKIGNVDSMHLIPDAAVGDLIGLPPTDRTSRLILITAPGNFVGPGDEVILSMYHRSPYWAIFTATPIGTPKFFLFMIAELLTFLSVGLAFFFQRHPNSTSSWLGIYLFAEAGSGSNYLGALPPMWRLWGDVISHGFAALATIALMVFIALLIAPFYSQRIVKFAIFCAVILSTFASGSLAANLIDTGLTGCPLIVVPSFPQLALASKILATLIPFVVLGFAIAHTRRANRPAMIPLSILAAVLLVGYTAVLVSRTSLLFTGQPAFTNPFLYLVTWLIPLAWGLLIPIAAFVFTRYPDWTRVLGRFWVPLVLLHLLSIYLVLLIPMLWLSLPIAVAIVIGVQVLAARRAS